MTSSRRKTDTGGKQTTASLPKRKMGALSTVGLLLMASAVIRGTVGAGEAWARETSPQSAAAANMSESVQATRAKAPQAEQHAAMQVASDIMPEIAPQEAPQPVMAIEEEALMPLIEALQAREDRVRAREEQIDIRMQALSVAEQEIERKLAALEEAESSLRATLALAQTAAEDDLSQLTDVYANMKPSRASALFEEMDPGFSAGFLSRMKPASAAAIMAGLSPEAAYRISVVLAGRNADVPTQ